MDQKVNSVFVIMQTALRLFKEKGFDETGIREISKATGISLGLVNHYFGNKEFLGMQCMRVLSAYCTQHLDEKVSLYDDPILYDLVMTRTFFLYLNHCGYTKFYIDSLKNDFFKYINEEPPVLIELLKKSYAINADADEILLYTRYMPYMMEKTLVLKKAENLFESIDYEHIPYLIVSTAMSHFIPEKDIAARDARSIQITNELIAPLEANVPDEFIMNCTEKYLQKFKAASAQQRNDWIKTMRKA